MFDSNKIVFKLISDVQETRSLREILGCSLDVYLNETHHKFDYSFMILTIESEWNFNDFVKPIQLVGPSNQNSFSGTCKTAEIPGVLANILQYHGMDCISDNNCMQLWANKGYDMKINSRHQCADRNGVSPCSGDSGSPLTKVNNKGVTVLVGNFAAMSRG